jgi:molybdopterin-guanine dinucleotide biosynthesis protein A
VQTRDEDAANSRLAHFLITLPPNSGRPAGSPDIPLAALHSPDNDLTVAVLSQFTPRQLIARQHGRAMYDCVDRDCAGPEDGDQPLCACYARPAAGPIRRRLWEGALKITDVLSELRVREIGSAEIARFDPDGVPFFNVDTPDDYQRTNACIERC